MFVFASIMAAIAFQIIILTSIYLWHDSDPKCYLQEWSFSKHQSNWEMKQYEFCLIYRNERQTFGEGNHNLRDDEQR